MTLAPRLGDYTKQPVNTSFGPNDWWCCFCQDKIGESSYRFNVIKSAVSFICFCTLASIITPPGFIVGGIWSLSEGTAKNNSTYLYIGIVCISIGAILLLLLILFVGFVIVCAVGLFYGCKKLKARDANYKREMDAKNAQNNSNTLQQQTVQIQTQQQQQQIQQQQQQQFIPQQQLVYGPNYSQQNYQSQQQMVNQQPQQQQQYYQPSPQQQQQQYYQPQQIQHTQPVTQQQDQFNPMQGINLN